MVNIMSNRGINKVILVGNLGQNPETRTTTNGSFVSNISIATTETWKDKQSGETQNRTEWHRVVFFNRLAEIVDEYLKKGSKIYIEGSLRTNKWQDRNGHDRYTTEIVANEMQMLDSLSNKQSSERVPKNPSRSNNNQASQRSAQPALPNIPDSSQMDESEFEDDIPF